MRLTALALPSLLLVLAASVLPTAAWAQEQKPANEQVVVPQVDRRDVKLPKFPSRDFELGAYTGTYATQNFGSSSVSGVRLGYHITEDVFVEGVLGRTKVSDALVRNLLGAGILPSEHEKLTYYNISAGLNVLPGEVFIGARRAKPSQLYLIGGVGSTKFDQQRRPTYNVGFGFRVYLVDSLALQLDMRDHIYSLDLLGKRQSTQNLELTGGLTFNF